MMMEKWFELDGRETHTASFICLGPRKKQENMSFWPLRTRVNKSKAAVNYCSKKKVRCSASKKEKDQKIRRHAKDFAEWLFPGTLPI
jgi:hypothetical protein